MSNIKIIAVTGATGSQGGGVVNVMKKTPGWKVRAVTRNPESEAAKKLAADGLVEVVRADFNDEASLVKAFEVCMPPPGRHYVVSSPTNPFFDCRVSRPSSP
jgi:NAD(P)-dependent dehydrogenase (short-subunit alcohol dehydrogenase family)